MQWPHGHTRVLSGVRSDGRALDGNLLHALRCCHQLHLADYTHGLALATRRIGTSDGVVAEARRACARIVVIVWPKTSRTSVRRIEHPPSPLACMHDEYASLESIPAVKAQRTVVCCVRRAELVVQRSAVGHSDARGRRDCLLELDQQPAEPN